MFQPRQRLDEYLRDPIQGECVQRECGRPGSRKPGGYGSYEEMGSARAGPERATIGDQPCWSSA